MSTSVQEPPSKEFIIEQYIQYSEMRRSHSVYSWQAIAFGVLFVILLGVVDKETIEVAVQNPWIPAFGLLYAALFFIVMLWQHKRNLFYLQKHEEVLAQMEEKYGVPYDIYHHQIQPKGLLRLSSSRLLSWFLLLVILGLFASSLYFFALWLPWL